MPPSQSPFEDLAVQRASNGAARPFMTSFLEHLVKNRVITPDIAQQAVEWKQQNNNDRRTLLELLKEEFGVAGDELNPQVAQFYAFRVIDINERGARRLLSADAMRLVKGLPDSMRQLAMKHKVLPYDLAENQADKIVVVTPNPSDREVSDIARAFPYKRFEICYMKERDWAEYWRQISVDRQVKQGPGGLEVATDEEGSDLEAILDKEINRGQLTALMENLFADAVRVGATDIHITPRAARTTDVLFRMDGQLSLWYSIEDARTEAVAAAVKSRSQNLDRYERMAAQEGAAYKTIDRQTVRFLVSSLPVASREPAARHESIVVQVLKDADPGFHLETLGLGPVAFAAFKETLRGVPGLVLATGPARSGRHATLVAAMRSCLRPTLCALTVEDPVKYLLDGVRQVKINHKLPYEDAVRAILAHDPDMVMLGKIEGKERALAALRLALSGKRVFSLLDAHDAVGALQRLYCEGVEPYVLAHGIRLVSAQRLLRKLCDRCKEPATGSEIASLMRLGAPATVAAAMKLYRPVGCIDCVGGFKGRVAIHETLVMTSEIRETIANSLHELDTANLRRLAVLGGMRNLSSLALEQLEQGKTTLDEVFGAMSI